MAYNTVKLGAKVILKSTNEEHTIVGLDLSTWLIAIDIPKIQKNIKYSRRATIYLDTDINYYGWVSLYDIEVI